MRYEVVALSDFLEPPKFAAWEAFSFSSDDPSARIRAGCIRPS
jgi:hypothetical protein